jgi:hypothetical protein
VNNVDGQDAELARRLAARPSADLAAFILDLAHAEGPLGEHVRTFLLAEDAVACLASIEDRLERIAHPPHRRHSRLAPLRGISARLGYVLDDIERLALPLDPVGAFALLVRLIECDGPAAEDSVEEDWEIAQLFGRAVALLKQMAPGVPAEVRVQATARLLAADEYGLRRGVREALAGPELD